MILVNIMTSAAAIVVTAAANMDGPIKMSASLVRSWRLTLPGRWL
jgi:hypothetical protein